jgi:hypothetical protein
MVSSRNGLDIRRADVLGESLAEEHARLTDKPARTRKPKAKADDKPATKPPGPDQLRPWAYAGIGLSISLSAVLNGFANAQHAPIPWAGWILGLWVPALVLVFARAGGVCYARGWRNLAAATGLVVLALLALSVSHCARSFVLLTGADTVSSVLMAIGIDAGLVCCELMTVRKGK